MKAIVTNPQVPGHLAIGEFDPPVAGRSEALVRVRAISLNRGEVRRSQLADAGWRPGWDLAGVVEQAAADGSGPPAGARVVGILLVGAWAEVVAVPTENLAELPPEVDFADASTLPVAALTALYALDRAGNLLGRNVLVTGASGGVGHFAIQLAHAGGAQAVASLRRPDHADLLRQAGADHVVVSEDAAGCAEFGPYDLVIESVGGPTLGNVLLTLAPNGTCVTMGTSSEAAGVMVDAQRFRQPRGVSLYGLFVFHELRVRPASDGFARLLKLMPDGRLKPHIALEAPWTEIGPIALQLLERQFPGKAVLHVTS